MQKSTQNNSAKGELEEHSMWHLKVHLRFNFKKHKKLQKKMHWTFQLMVHLELQSRVHLWISDLALYVSFIYSAEQTGKQNCWHFRIRVHRRVRMPIRGRRRLVVGGGGWESIVLATPFSSESAYMGDSESKKFTLFQRTYFMDTTLVKKAP